jgi:hypothetical protein
LRQHLREIFDVKQQLAECCPEFCNHILRPNIFEILAVAIHFDADRLVNFDPLSFFCIRSGRGWRARYLEILSLGETPVPQRTCPQEKF